MTEVRAQSVAPSEQATPVDDPQIAEVLDLSTGETREVKLLIKSLRYDQAIAHRGLIRERLATDDPLYACAYCGVLVYLLSQTDRRRFFFRHTLEDGRCNAKTRGRLSQDEIRARQYQGMREGAAHKVLKALIERGIRSDPLFQNVEIETTWRAHDPKLRRKPDVSANYQPFGQIAFEAQVSRTFLDVVAERRVFYRTEGALLVWVLRHFDPQYRRLMVDDLLFSNNSNVLIVDEETTQLSEERDAFHVRCHFRRPYREGFNVKEEWGEAVVPFASLTLDAAGQRAFSIDFAGEEKRLREAAEAALRAEFLELLEAEWPHDDLASPLHARWTVVTDLLAQRGIHLCGSYPQYDSEIRTLVIAVRSMELGRPFIWKDATLVASVHRIITQHKRAVVALVEAIKHFGRKDLLIAQDESKKWSKKKGAIFRAIQGLEKDYLPEADHVPLIQFLYPEIGQQVGEYVKRFWEETTS